MKLRREHPRCFHFVSLVSNTITYEPRIFISEPMALLLRWSSLKRHPGIRRTLCEYMYWEEATTTARLRRVLTISKHRSVLIAITSEDRNLVSPHVSGPLVVNMNPQCLCKVRTHTRLAALRLISCLVGSAAGCVTRYLIFYTRQ